MIRMPKYIAKVKTNKGTRYFYDRVEYDAYRRSTNATAITNARLNNVNASNAFINAITGKERFTLKPSKKQPTNSAKKSSDSQPAKHPLYKLPKDSLKYRIQRAIEKRPELKQTLWALYNLDEKRPKSKQKQRGADGIQPQKRSKSKQWDVNGMQLKKYVDRHKAPRRMSTVLSDAKYRVTSTTNR